MFNAIIKTPFGKIGIRANDKEIEQIVYLSESIPCLLPNNLLAKKAVKQINDYLISPKIKFDLPLATFNGTDFQQTVWTQISAIPLGKVITYKDIANRLNTAPRAIGGACGRNLFPLLIPCHRVVAQKSIGGFMQGNENGFYAPIKKWLLQHEKALR